MNPPSDDPRVVMRDPVCGMSVDPETTLRIEHGGKTWLFCNPKCLERFCADPTKYLEPRPPGHGMSLASDTLNGPIHTCPMHPEVRRQGAGACPECGMALEPVEVDPADTPDPEALDMRRRLVWAAAFTIPLVTLAMAGHLLGLHVPWRLSGLIQAGLAAPVVLWGGWPFFVRGFGARCRPNMFTLIGLGVGVSFLYSLAAVALPGLFPLSARGPDGAVGFYFESAATIVTLVLVGQVLEGRARGRTSEALKALMRLQPATALRISPQGRDEEVPIACIGIGDLVRVRCGEQVPVDGVVTAGFCAMDESSMTGEPLPVEKGPGDRVMAGTLARDGSVVVRAEAVGSATLLSQIVRQVTEAQRTRAPIQALADRVASWFVPSVVAVAALAFVGWLWFAPSAALAHAMTAAVSVLIIACPCALGLATPVAVVVAMGRAARAGILFREARAIEGLRDVDVLVVDKTGTLTEGRPRVRDVSAVGDLSVDEVLFLAASVERGSKHPLARALVAAAVERGIVLAEASGFWTSAGPGVEGEVMGRRVAVGSGDFLVTTGVDLTSLQGKVTMETGLTVTLVAVDGRPAAVITFEDPVKATTPEAVAGLRAEGLRVVMVTGDASDAVRAVARFLGIEDVVSGATPLDKVAVIKRLQAAGHRVAAAGDGVNDAPALASADVGIAMGTGADVAMHSAPVTLVRGDLRAILQARRLSRMTVRTIRWNLLFAFAYNTVCVPVAAGVLFPWTGILLTPAIAAAAMSMSSLSVIWNSLRLTRARV